MFEMGLRVALEERPAITMMAGPNIKEIENYFFLAVFAAGFLAGAFLAAAFAGFFVAIKTPCFTFFGIIAV